MAQTKHKEMDMLHGGLAGKLILFALPLAFSSILQQLSTQQMWPLSAGLRVIRRWRRSAAVWRSSVFLST